MYEIIWSSSWFTCLLNKYIRPNDYYMVDVTLIGHENGKPRSPMIHQQRSVHQGDILCRLDDITKHGFEQYSRGLWDWAITEYMIPRNKVIGIIIRSTESSSSYTMKMIEIWWRPYGPFAYDDDENTIVQSLGRRGDDTLYQELGHRYIWDSSFSLHYFCSLTRYGHLPTIKIWMFQRYSKQYGTSAVENYQWYMYILLALALVEGHFHILQWLQGPQQLILQQLTTTTTDKTADDNEEMIQWYHDKFHCLIREPLDSSFLWKMAIIGKQPCSIQWLQDNNIPKPHPIPTLTKKNTGTVLKKMMYKYLFEHFQLPASTIEMEMRPFFAKVFTSDL